MSISHNVGLVIPTLNAGRKWERCLERIKCQTLTPHRLLNIDSASTDATTQISRAAGFETIEIERSNFSHGGTRQWAAAYLADCEIIVFLTQDAILSSCNDIAEIVRCFDDPTIAIAYGRQLPHEGSTGIEAHARLFNYGAQSIKKDATSARQLGAKVFFCSNSFAAYRRSTMLELGGFRHDLILGEDMEFAARAIKAGYANLYCATAAVYHSHDYSIGEVVGRYFDIGAFDKNNSWMREQFGSHTGEGLRFVASELKYLLNRSPMEIPRSLIQTAGKWVGYKLGRMERRVPINVKRKLSMHANYWQ